MRASIARHAYLSSDRWLAGRFKKMPTIAMAWFPQGELEKALARWPGFVERWEIKDHADYCRRVDDELRVMTSHGIAPLEVAPINVEEFVAWCEEQGVDPGQAESRSQFAAVLANRGRTISWPPSRNGVCWCGSGQKYKWCCGHARPLPELPDE